MYNPIYGFTYVRNRSVLSITGWSIAYKGGNNRFDFDAEKFQFSW